MATKRRITAELGLDGKQAEESLKGFKKLVSSTFTEMNSAAELAGKAWGVISGAIGSAVHFMGEAVTAANESEASERRLATALKLRGQYTNESFESMKRLAGEIERTTTINHVHVEALQSQLAALGVTKEQMAQATKAAIGLSEITGKALTASARDVARVLRDGTNPALMKLGLQGHSAAETMQNLASAMSLARDKAETFAGKQEQLNNAWGVFMESLGGSITQNGEAKKTLDGLKGAVEQITLFVDNQSNQDKVSQFFKTVQSGIVLTSKMSLLLIDVAELMTNTLGATEFFSHEIFGTEEKFFVEMSDSIEKLKPELKQLQKNIEDAFKAPTKSPWSSWDDIPRGPADRFGANMTPGKTKAEVAAEKAAAAARKKAADEAEKAAIAERMAGLSADALKILDKKDFMTREQALDEQRKDIADQRRVYEIDRASEHSMRMQAIDKKDADKKTALLKKLNDDNKRLTAEERAEWVRANTEFGSIALSGFSNAIASVTQALAEGNADAGDVAKALTGGVISALGNLLIQLGTAAVLAGGIGTVVPFLAPLTGGPGGIALGLGAIAAGSIMVGLGGALGHSAGPSAARVGGAGANGRSGFAAPEQRGFSAGFGQGGGPVTNITNVSVRGLIVGSDRALAREIDRIRRAGDTMTVGAH